MMYSGIMISDKDRKMEEIVIGILEDFNSYSTNISSEISRRMIAKAVVKKIKKIYNYDVKYFYS
tara:strand:- start:55 stop:246 length:192 start_codon:yes stop_codon:yes gene_type:complete